MTGGDELRDALLELPKRLQQKVLNAALLAASGAMVTSAQARAPVLIKPDPRRRPGTVQKAIRALALRQPEAGLDAEVTIGVRPLSAKRILTYKRRIALRRLKNASHGPALLKTVNSANNPNDPFYWLYLEFGTSTQPAKPFLRPAFEETVGAMQDAFTRTLDEVIAEAARDLDKGPA
jgi:HK97 gp10 family phage protein